MKKRFVCILLVFLLILPLFVFTAAAEDGQSTDNTTATTATQATQATQPPPSSTPTTPPATQPTTPASTESTQPSTQPSTESTQPSTESTQPSTTPTTSPSACSHTYGEWSASVTNHTRSCTKCTYTESTAHTWFSETVTVAPTCKDAGGTAKICTVCEYLVLTDIQPPLTTHTYKNDCDTECDVCGLKREITHKYSAAWSKNGKGHWHACTICGAAGELKAHYPGPAATEEKEQICLTCGYVLMRKKSHTHEYSKEWTSDSAGHWHVCDGCSELKDYAAHSYENGCDTDCGICGYTRNAVHTFGADWVKDEKTHSGVCTLCGEKVETEDHIPDASGASCSVCGYALEAAEETEAVHEHTYDGAWEYDDDGHWQTCSCGEKKESQTHSWDEGREAGKKTILYTCKTCGAQMQEQQEGGSFPWLAVLIGIVMVGALAGIIVCIVLLRKESKYGR